MEQKQHVVPQVLLERFSNDGRLVLVDRDDRFRIPTSVERALKIGGYYDIEEDVVVDLKEFAEPLRDLETDPGLRDQIIEIDGGSGRLRRGAVEAFLGLIEQRAAGALRNVDTELGLVSQDASDRFWLSGLMALQHVRGEAFRSQMDQLMRASIRHFVESDPTSWVEKWNADRRRRGLPPQPPDAVISTLLSSLEEMRLGGSRLIGEAIRLAFDEIAPRLFAGVWRLLRYKTHDVVTSDAGVGLWARPGRDLYREPLAIGSADCIFFPVSSMAILQILPPGSAVPEGEIQGSPAKLRQSNSTVASAAHRWIVAHPDCGSLDELSVGDRTAVGVEVVTRRNRGTEVREIIRFFTQQAGEVGGGAAG